jgi:uncharacterized protein (TIGR02270 family)
MRQHEPIPRYGNEPARPLVLLGRESGAEACLLERDLGEIGASRAKPAHALQRPIGSHSREIINLISFPTGVVAPHADDAPFLWLLRDRAVAAPHFSLRDLARLDDRVEAHVDGLRVAGDSGWRLSEKALDWEEPGEVFTAGVLALESNSHERLDRVLRVMCKGRELQRGLISAAGWTPFEPLQPTLQSWLESEVPAMRRVAVGAFAVQRQDLGQSLPRLLYDDDAGVRARAMKAAAELGRVDMRPMLLRARAGMDPACCLFAAWAAARLGDRSAETLDILRDFAVTPGPYQERALALVTRCLPLAEAISWLRQLGNNPRRLRLAALGAGVAGDPALAGVLIEWMATEAVARVAGEAFTMITGADLENLGLSQDLSENHFENDEEYQAEAHDVQDPDRDLPNPVPSKVADWWRANRDRFEPGRRYLYGSEIEPDGLRKVLLWGKQRQREAAALELALLQPAEPLFEVRAPGSLQQRTLQARAP